MVQRHGSKTWFKDMVQRHGSKTWFREMSRNSILTILSFFFNIRKSNSSLYSSKRAISPVVSAVLLITVAVVAIVTFQLFYDNFSSSVFSDVEVGSGTLGTNSVETIVDDKLYIKTGEDNLTIIRVELDGNDCDVAGVYGTGVIEINISSCLANITSEIADVVIVTSEGVFSETLFLPNIASGGSSASLDCSALNGGEWIEVPGNAALGTSDFCVMKYEAKNVGGIPTSQALLTPWVIINQFDARSECNSLGSGYSLITDAQLVTIARDAELQESNWDSEKVYSGSMMRGHTDGTPFAALSVSNINNPYDQTGQSSPSIERRTLNLSNGEVIWDIGGNVWEWTSDNLSTTGAQNSSLGLGNGWHQWNTVNSTIYGYLMPLNTSLTSTNGIGQVYPDSGPASDLGNVHAFLRGGFFNSGVLAGAFSLALEIGPWGVSPFYGFRCSYEP